MCVSSVVQNFRFGYVLMTVPGTKVGGTVMLSCRASSWNPHGQAYTEIEVSFDFGAVVFLTLLSNFGTEDLSYSRRAL